MNLYEQTLRRLATSKVGYRQIAKDIGVSERWVYKIARGETSDPSVHLIQRLHDYLGQQDQEHAA